MPSSVAPARTVRTTETTRWGAISPKSSSPTALRRPAWTCALISGRGVRCWPDGVLQYGRSLGSQVKACSEGLGVVSSLRAVDAGEQVGYPVARNACMTRTASGTAPARRLTNARADRGAAHRAHPAGRHGPCACTYVQGPGPMKCPVAMRRVVLCTGVALGSACSFGTTQARPEAVIPRSCFGASAQETELACIVDGQPVICSELFGSSIVNQCSMPYDPRGMVTVAGATPVTRVAAQGIRRRFARAT